MPHTPWQILVADDEEDFRIQVKETFEGVPLDDTDRVAEVIVTERLEQALELLSTHRIDLLILDLREGTQTKIEDEQLGNTVMQKIKLRRFVPVVFYTGIPHRVEEEETEVLKIVKKDDGVQKLDEVIRAIFATGIPAANRAIMRHVEHVQRDFMWQSHGLLTTYKASIDKLSLAYLMARRLAASLQRNWNRGPCA